MTKREQQLVEAAKKIRLSLSEDDEYDQQSQINILNEALALYGYNPIEQRHCWFHPLTEEESKARVERYRFGRDSAKKAFDDLPTPDGCI